MLVTYPKYLIVGTREIVTAYQATVSGLVSNDDITEIMTQVVQKIINYDYFEDDQYKPTFPDFSRLIHKEFLNNSYNTGIVTQATEKLLVELYTELEFLKTFQNKDFPYFFYQFVGKDILLQQLPF
jgi:hypothetical protein